MSQYGWVNCPEAVHTQVVEFLEALRETLGANLIGIYLHGSLAMGCFNPERSDIDLLVVTRRGMGLETKRCIAELLLHYSASPRPIEISFLRERDLAPWEYPTPFDFHYSEDWREKYEKHLSSGDWKKWNDEAPRDEDLAAHITVTLRRGICLYGKPISEVFPPVPEEHLIASIVGDFHWARDRMDHHLVYFVLNACRVYAYLLEGRVYSKDEAGAWAVHALPKALQGTVTRALEAYRGDHQDARFDAAALERFAGYMGEQVAWGQREAP